MDTQLATQSPHFNALSTGKVELGRNFLKVITPATDGELAQIFDSLSTLKGSSMFWIGDFLVHAETTKGEAYAKALALTDNAPDTLYKAKWVCKAFPPATRLNLSYTHHIEVLGACGGDAEEAISFLKVAERENLSVKAIRKYVRQSLADPFEEPEEAPEVIYKDNDFLVVIDSFNNIGRYLQNVTSATSATNRSFIKAEIEKLNDLAKKHLT